MFNCLCKKSAKVIGIDISEKQLKFANELAKKNKVNIKFYQGDIKKLPKIKSESQDIVFSAFALHYVDDLLSCFKEVNRVLKNKGVFVFSLDHPMYRMIDSNTLKLKDSYFNTGKEVFTFSDPTKEFVCYKHTISDLYEKLTKTKFFIDKIIEPDSRKHYSYDPWYNLWDYKPDLLRMVPPTIIFRAIKEV